MAENTYKKPEKEKKNDGAKSKSSGIFRSLLNGNILAGERTQHLFPFLLFVTVIAAFLIANNYYAEKKVRQIERMRNELTEMRTHYISNKAELMHLSNQSEVARRLHERGFVESTVPPRSIYVPREQRNFFLRIGGGRSN